MNNHQSFYFCPVEGEQGICSHIETGELHCHHRTNATPGSSNCGFCGYLFIHAILKIQTLQLLFNRCNTISNTGSRRAGIRGKKTNTGLKRSPGKSFGARGQYSLARFPDNKNAHITTLSIISIKI